MGLAIRLPHKPLDLSTRDSLVGIGFIPIIHSRISDETRSHEDLNSVDMLAKSVSFLRPNPAGFYSTYPLILCYCCCTISSARQYSLYKSMENKKSRRASPSLAVEKDE